MLAKTYRLKLKNDFEIIFKEGKFVSQKFFTLGFIKNTLNFSRFAIVVPKKVANSAVIRNSIKRKASEVIRLNMNKIKTGFDMVFIGKAPVKGKKYQELMGDIGDLLEKARLIKQ